MYVFFAYVKNIFIKSGIAHVYPSFVKEIDCYEKYFRTHSLISNIVNGDFCKYQAIFNYEKDNLYSLEWNISEILEKLKDYPLKTLKISPNSDLLYHDDSVLEPDKVSFFVNHFRQELSSPILLVWIEFVRKFYVIDGNHRLEACKRNGYDRINAVILPAGFHLHYMIDEESRIRYKIFHNIAIMGNIINHKKCKVSAEYDDKNTIYPITDNTIRIGPLRYYRYLLRLFFKTTSDALIWHPVFL